MSEQSEIIGGDACESNTPKTFCAPHNGFEGRGAHQDPFVSVCLNCCHVIQKGVWHIICKDDNRLVVGFVFPINSLINLTGNRRVITC